MWNYPLYEDFDLNDMNDVDWTDAMSDADDNAEKESMIRWCKEQGIDEKFVSIDKDGISLLCTENIGYTTPSIRIILRPGQTELPFPLNVIDIDVDVSWNGLTSMKNFPKVIKGGLFNADYNLITNLDNLPVIDMPDVKPACGWPCISLSFNNFSGPDKITAATDMTSDFLKSDKNTEYMSDSQRYASPFTFGNIKNFGYTYGRQHPARMVNLAGNRALNKYDLSRNMSVRSVRSNDTIFDDRAFISKSLRKKYISDKAKKLKT